MLDRLLCWYVFNVYKQVSYKMNFAALAAVYVLASCLDHIFGGHNADFAAWLWGIIMAIEILILINAYLRRFLDKNLIIHSDYDNPHCERYFLSLNQETGAVCDLSETDIILTPDSDLITLIHFTIPLFSDKDEESEEGLIVKKAGSVQVSLSKSDEVVNFDVFLSMTGEYDQKTLIDFISKQYFNTAVAHTSYEDYVTECFLGLSQAWMTQADNEAYEDLKNSGKEMFEPPVHAVLKKFMRIVRENFHPRLLPNVLDVTVAFSGGEERPASARPPGWEQVMAKKDQQEE